MGIGEGDGGEEGTFISTVYARLALRGWDIAPIVCEVSHTRKRGFGFGIRLDRGKDVWERRLEAEYDFVPSRNG